MQYGDIQFIDFHKVLQMVENCCWYFKADIRNQAKKKERQITKEQQEELLEKERKESKEEFLQQIPSTWGSHGGNAS